VPGSESCRPYGSGNDQSVAQCASAVFMTWTNSATVPWKGSGSHFLRWYSDKPYVSPLSSVIRKRGSAPASSTRPTMMCPPRTVACNHAWLRLDRVTPAHSAAAPGARRRLDDAWLEACSAVCQPQCRRATASHGPSRCARALPLPGTHARQIGWARSREDGVCLCLVLPHGSISLPPSIVNCRPGCGLEPPRSVWRDAPD
jgi:hypothetical protein